MNPRAEPLAPVALFAFNRPDHLSRTLAALSRGPLASRTDLIAFVDGPRGPADLPAVTEVRRRLANVTGFRSVRVSAREKNAGLARSIIEGVTAVCAGAGRVIVVEDDLLTSPHFLAYMNDALNRYADCPEVASVHGYVYPLREKLPETFFLRGADCWGWGTWVRAWREFNPDGATLWAQLQARGLVKDFDYGGSAPYSRMLRDQIDGRNNSWAIRWHASAYLAGRLTLYPGRTLVQNIGLSGGTHFDHSDFPDAPPAADPVAVNAIPVVESPAARAAFARFFRRRRGSALRRLLHRMVAWLRRKPAL